MLLLQPGLGIGDLDAEVLAPLLEPTHLVAEALRPVLQLRSYIDQTSTRGTGTVIIRRGNSRPSGEGRASHRRQDIQT